MRCEVEMDQQSGQELKQKKGWKRARKRTARRRRSSIIEDVVAQVLAGGVPPLQLPAGDEEEDEGEEGSRSGSCLPTLERSEASGSSRRSTRRGNCEEEEMLEEVAKIVQGEEEGVTSGTHNHRCC